MHGRPRVNDAMLSSSPVTVFDPLQIHLLSREHLKKAVCLIPFTGGHLIKYLSSAVNRIVVTPLILTSSLGCCQQRIFEERPIIFRHLDAAFPQLYCQKFSLYCLIFLKATSKKGVFFGPRGHRPPMLATPPPQTFGSNFIQTLPTFRQSFRH